MCCEMAGFCLNVNRGWEPYAEIDRNSVYCLKILTLSGWFNHFSAKNWIESLILAKKDF